MPAANGFRHQQYTGELPHAAYAVLTPDAQSSVPEASTLRLTSAVRSMFGANVARIILVHGTIVGTDTLGLFREIAKFTPHVAEYLSQLEKSAMDALLGDTANYSSEYASRLQQSIETVGLGSIPVERFFWTSENHHFGRAEASIRLLNYLDSLCLQPSQRVLLLGHSHAGNIFALLSNLLGSDKVAAKRMFRAVRPVVGSARSSFATGIDSDERQNAPVAAADWERAWQLVQRRSFSTRLDFVTLGTPIRYGWDSGGYDRLLHFVNHRPADGLPEYRVPFPLSMDQLVHSSCGDFFQQFFIAGTNFPHSLFAWRRWRAERKLGRLFERGIAPGKLGDRLKCGQRVPHEGQTLLVDYTAADPISGPSMMGHGVYTRSDWAAFHLCEIATRFYSAQNVSNIEPSG